MIAGKRERVTSGISDKREPDLASRPPTFLPHRESLEQAKKTLKKKKTNKQGSGGKGKLGGGDAGKQGSRKWGSGDVGRRESKYQARMLREVRKQGTGEENRGRKEGSREVEKGREEEEKQESMEAEKQGNKYQASKKGW